MSKRKTHEEHLNDLLVRGITHKPVDQYVTAIKHITYKCLENHTWLATPNKILSGRGCPICKSLSTGKRCKKTDSEYKAELVPFKIVNIDTYDGAHKVLRHKCSKNHTWSIAPTTLLGNIRCPECSPSGVFKGVPTTMYYVRLIKDGDRNYKIGLTTENNTLDRFKADKDKSITVLKEWYFDCGAEAYREEQKIIAKYKKFCNKTKSYMRRGFTEVFDIDVLNLDK